MSVAAVARYRCRRSCAPPSKPPPHGCTGGADSIRSWISRAEAKAGLATTGKAHVLRHTLLSHLAMKGAPLRTIQEVAGHHALTMTARYLHLSPTAKNEAIGLLEGTLEN